MRLAAQPLSCSAGARPRYKYSNSSGVIVPLQRPAMAGLMRSGASAMRHLTANGIAAWGTRLLPVTIAAAASGSASRSAMPHRTKVSLRAAGRTAKAPEAPNGASDPHAAAKSRALATVMKEINDKFGKGSLMTMNDTSLKVETIPSGALTLDIALGGGFPRGRIVEIFGPESSGKTTLALHAMAAVQKMGGTAALIDAEHAFDPIYAKKAGLDLSKLLLCQPDYGEMGLDVADTLIRSSAVDVICVDSVAALTPKAEIEGEVGMQQIGLQARMMSQVLRKITSNASKANCTVIFINQLRHKVGVIFGNPEVTTGGQALKFYSSVRIDVRRKASVKSPKGDTDVGIRVRAKVAKNKVAAPYKVAEFDILFSSGISSLGCLLDAAEHTAVVSRRGSYYYYGDVKLAQGRENTISALKDNAGLTTELEARVREAVAGVDINDWYDEEAAASAAASLEVEEEEEEEGLPLDDVLGELMVGGEDSAASTGRPAGQDGGLQQQFGT